MKTLTLEERACQIQAKLDAGVRIPTREQMMNNGRRRTRSKRELLAELRRMQDESGRPAVFEAKF